MNASAALPEPSWVSEPVLLAIHSRQIERYGGAHGIRDGNIVRSALARPQHRWTYDPSADMADLSACYLVGFARTQGFNDGNKRTGLACALVFLNGNRFELHVPPAELLVLTMRVANGAAGDEAVAAYFRARMKAR